jgi:putative two-component system response regulator
MDAAWQSGHRNRRTRRALLSIFGSGARHWACTVATTPVQPAILPARSPGRSEQRFVLVREAAYLLVIRDGRLNLRIITCDPPRRRRSHGLLTALDGQRRPLARARIDVIEGIAVTGDDCDDALSEHTRRVGDLSAQLAWTMGLDADDVRLMSRAASLHDIGKIGIPQAILRKPARLTDAEMRIMQTHTTIGFYILGGSADPLLQLAAAIALSHHERWDGTGYPHALAGREIPLAGRIVAVADAFDALTNDRPYRNRSAVAQALAEISGQRGTKFDADVVDALQAVAVDGEFHDAGRSSAPASFSYRSIA